MNQASKAFDNRFSLRVPMIKAAFDKVVTYSGLSPLGKQLLRVVNRGLRLNGYCVSSFRREHSEVLELIRTVRSERRLMIRNDEAFHLFTAAASAAKVPGDLAEFGVFEGASAKLICEAKGGRTLHLFDTFEGLPRPGPLDASHFAEGDFQCSVESVREYLSPYQKVEYHKGLFWESSRRIGDKKFCFVNIDVDLYESTLAAFEFFYPRMTPGGIMMSHDYTGEPAVRSAIDGFFATRPETVIELVGTQCLIVKTGAGDG